MTSLNHFSVGCLLTRPQQSKSLSEHQTAYDKERHEIGCIERAGTIRNKVLKKQSIESSSTQKQNDKQFKQFWLPCLSNKKTDVGSQKPEEQQLKLAHSKSQKFIPQVSSERALSQKALSTTLEDSDRFDRLHFVLKPQGKESLKRHQKNGVKNNGQDYNNKIKISEQHYNFKKKRINEIELTASLCKMCQKNANEKKKLQLQLMRVKQKLDLLKQLYDESYQRIMENLKKMQTDLSAMVEKFMEDTLCKYQWHPKIRKQNYLNIIFPQMKQEYTIKQSVDDLIEEVSQNILKGIQRQIQNIVDKRVTKNRKVQIGKIIKNGRLLSKEPLTTLETHKLEWENKHLHLFNQHLQDCFDKQTHDSNNL